MNLQRRIKGFSIQEQIILADALANPALKRLLVEEIAFLNESLQTLSIPETFTPEDSQAFAARYKVLQTQQVFLHELAELTTHAYIRKLQHVDEG